MRKLVKLMVASLLLVSVLFGCGQAEETGKEDNQPNQQSMKEENVTVTISEDHNEKVITEKEVTFSEGDLLLDVLKQNFNVEDNEGFITSIEGVAQDEEAGKYWIFYVNGEMGMVGANEYELQAGDNINFDLQAME